MYFFVYKITFYFSIKINDLNNDLGIKTNALYVKCKQWKIDLCFTPQTSNFITTTSVMAFLPTVLLKGHNQLMKYGS